MIDHPSVSHGAGRASQWKKIARGEAKFLSHQNGVSSLVFLVVREKRYRTPKKEEFSNRFAIFHFVY